MTKKQTLRVIALVYGAVLLGGALLGLAYFTADSIDRARGALQTHTLRFADFARQDIEPILELSTDAALTTTEDPQLVLDDLSALGKVRTVSFDIRFSKDPGEVTLYYTAANQPFDKDKKVWGKLQNDGSYSFTLPRTGVGRLRVDPTNQTGVSMTLLHFTLNAPRTFGSYFAPTTEAVFKYFVYTGFAAAALCYVLAEFGPALRAVGAKMPGLSRLRKNGKPQELPSTQEKQAPSN